MFSPNSFLMVQDLAFTRIELAGCEPAVPSPGEPKVKTSKQHCGIPSAVSSRSATSRQSSAECCAQTIEARNTGNASSPAGP